VCVRLRKLTLKTNENRRAFRRGLLGGNAGLQAAKCREPGTASVSSIFIRQRKRRPHIGDAHERKLKSSGHDSDNNVCLAVNLYVSPDDFRIARIPALPESLAENGYMRSARAILILSEGPAKDGLSAQHVKIIPADASTFD